MRGLRSNLEIDRDRNRYKNITYVSILEGMECRIMQSIPDILTRRLEQLPITSYKSRCNRNLLQHRYHQCNNDEQKVVFTSLMF